ncbi:MAG: DNA recombination protein RmuC [Alphaproteobacteria bacterium]|nr:DNA recombination protein RmuC [Alphaproteobacteria bacterium]
MRKESDERGRALRKEVGDGILQFGSSVQTQLSDGRVAVDKRMEEAARTQTEFANALRDEVRKTIASFGEGLKTDVKTLTDANAASQEMLRQVVTERLDKMRMDNEVKLESMRATVEEKLQGTLEKRLGESFTMVSERLEMVHKGLGEMQSLAIGVGDLKRVMSNVKDRGGWAEVQLGAMLEQVLARDQYVTNAKVEIGATEMVEYAVRMPGQGEGVDVLLPIDAKFPKETYERLMMAWEAGDGEGMRTAADELAGVIEGEAKRISTKYIRPPSTTDFAVMYVPTEGLFAEAMRAPGLAQRIQQRYRVTIAGPSTLHALLNSLQMGFRTLAIQKRSSEVWRVLGEAKAEFQRYAEVWDKLDKQLQTAQKTIQDVGIRTRAVERKLRQVEVSDLPAGAQVHLELAPPIDDGDSEPVQLPVRRLQ